MHIKIAPLSFAILTILQATHVKAVPTFSGTEYTYTQPDGTWWTGYKYFSNIDIGGCSLTNIGYKNDNTGTFKMIATKNGCNIEEYLNPVNSSYQPPSPEFGPGVIGTGAWAQPPNPYYQQRDYADQGNISYKNGKLSINDKGFFTNTLTDTSNDNTSADYLVITSKRANTALVEVAVDTTLNVGKNLYIQQSVTNAAALLIQQNAAANIQGNLALWRQHSADPDGTTTDSRVLDMQSGTLTVDGDLITNHFESIVSRNSGASWLLKNNSKVSVGGNATVYQNTEASAISSEKSNIDITGDLKIFIDKRSNLDHRKDDTAPAIYNNDSAITANTILISSEGFVGINQIGESAIINTKNLNIDTTANNYNNSENIDKSIIIAGGKIIAEVSDLKTNGDALTVNGVSSLSLGENTPPTLNLDQNKALIKLGADSKIQSTASHGIVINNNIDSDIDLQNGTQIIVENNKNLLLDADGNATLHIYEGAVLSGNITLNGGNDTVNLNGTVDLDKIPTLDGGEDQTLTEFNTINFKNSQYTALDTSKFTNFQDFYLKDNSDISLLNNTNNHVFNASTSTGHGIFIENGSSLKTQGSFLLNSNLINSGVLDIRKGEDLLASNVVIANDYIGNNGLLVINTQLNGDGSDTDKLIINGDATGSTRVEINNIGGSGAKTDKGIHIIQTNTSASNTTFYLNDGFITAGAYDYSLVLKNAEENGSSVYDNWYLQSKSNKPTYTPDVGPYLAAETMGNTLFTMRLEDREGASQYQNLGSENEANVWVRTYGGHNKFKTLDNQLKTTGNSIITQVGTGLVTLGEEDQYNLGAMLGYAHYNGKTRSELTDRAAKTEINGYSLGLYGTWYAHPVEERGAYIDSWVLWNKFKNKVDTADQNYYKYDSSGITASIEVGGDYLLNEEGQKNWWIQPQAQLIYQGVHADNFKDAQNVDIYHGKDNVQIRMGAKTYLNIPNNGNKLTSYRPYIALNYIHNTTPYSVEIDQMKYKNEGMKSLGEFKLGLEGQVTQNNHVWINASYVAGSHDAQTYQGNIGWKYNF